MGSPPPAVKLQSPDTKGREAVRGDQTTPSFQLIYDNKFN